jgi:hypothetical protein
MNPWPFSHSEDSLGPMQNLGPPPRFTYHAFSKWRRHPPGPLLPRYYWSTERFVGERRAVGLTSNHPSAQGWSSRPRGATTGECQFAQFQDAILYS